MSKPVVLLAICLSLFAAGCSHMAGVSADTLSPLRLALSQRPAALQERAERGEAAAQMALALTYRYRIGGADQNGPLADRLVDQATASRGSTPITTYIAGLNGKPGRVSTIFVPRYDVSPAAAAMNERCLYFLALNLWTSEARRACGGAQAHGVLSVLWRAQHRIPLAPGRLPGAF